MTCRVWLAAVAALLFTGLAAPARATQGEREASLTALLGAPVGESLGADAQLLFHATDFWAFGATARGRWRVVDGSSASALIAARYTIDALTWVPSVSLSGGMQLAPQQGWSPAAAVQAELVMRAARTWGIVARVVVETNSFNPMGFRTLAGIGYVCYWGKTGATEL